MTYENVIGIAAGVFTSIAMLPQLVKVIKTRETTDLSVTTICVLITGVSLWVYYGFLKNELPIILSNAFSVLVNITLLICWLAFKKRK